MSFVPGDHNISVNFFIATFKDIIFIHVTVRSLIEECSTKVHIINIGRFMTGIHYYKSDHHLIELLKRFALTFIPACLFLVSHRFLSFVKRVENKAVETQLI